MRLIYRTRANDSVLIVRCSDGSRALTRSFSSHVGASPLSLSAPPPACISGDEFLEKRADTKTQRGEKLRNSPVPLPRRARARRPTAGSVQLSVREVDPRVCTLSPLPARHSWQHGCTPTKARLHQYSASACTRVPFIPRRHHRSRPRNLWGTSRREDMCATEGRTLGGRRKAGGVSVRAQWQSSPLKKSASTFSLGASCASRRPRLSSSMSMSVGKPPTSGSPTTSGVLMLCWPDGIELVFFRERWKASSHDKSTGPPRESAPPRRRDRRQRSACFHPHK